jgi:protein-tyrosine-phosphatase
MGLSTSDVIGIGSAAAGLMNSIIGSSSNANLNAKNRKWQAEQNTIAYERQKELTELSPVLQKRGLIQAGISPAAMNGYTGGTASVQSANSAPSSQSEYVPLDVTSAMSGYLAAKEAASIDATIQKTKAETKALELENRAKESTQLAWHDATSDSYYLDSAGNKHRPTDSDFNRWADDYVKTHGELPDLVKTGGVYSADAAAVNSAMSNFRAQIAQSGMYEAQAKLAQQIAQLKLGDRDVMSALYRMDMAQYNQLMAAVAKAKSDINVNATLANLNDAKTEEARQSIAESVAREALYNTERSAMENSSVNNLIDQLGGDKSTQQNLITVGKILLSIFSGFSSRLSGLK